MTPHPDHASADPSASTNAMAAALEAIRSGAATYAQASATWGIPQGTLKARIKRERAAQAKAPDPQRACNQGATAAQPTVIDLGTLHADPSNARIHDQRNKAAIAASIERHGFLGAVVVEKGTGRILAGNERTQQALAAGMLQGVVVQYDPQRQVPVIMADLDGREADRFALADNRTAELAVWDDDLLAKVLADMGEMGDLWTPAEIKAQLAELAPPPTREDETTPLPVPEIAVSQLGDVYELGPHRLVCGDCGNGGVVALLFGQEEPVAVLTDPPYGQNQPGVTNDAPKDLPAIVARCLATMPLRNGVCVAFQSPRTFPVWLDAARTIGKHHFERMLWLYKEAQNTYPWRGWLLTSEAILVTSVGVGKWADIHPYAHDCYKVSEVSGELSPDLGWHGSVKPLAIVQDILSRICPVGGLVYEPFCGSGTTLIAAAQVGCAARAVELDPRYCDVIRRRWTRWALANNQDPGPGALE